MSLIKQLFPSGRKFTPASSEVNWQYVNTLVHGPGAGQDRDEDANSALFACLTTYATDYTEAPLTVVREDRKGNDKVLDNDPLQALFDQPTPNGELTISEIRWWTAWALKTDGNAYWLKVRAEDANSGNVVQLWPISPTLIRPVTRKGSGEWISFYEYQIEPSVMVDVPVKNVVHFKHGLDDRDMRKGVSSLKVLLRQISTDDEADRFIEALLKNYAVPGLVVVPDQGVTLNETDADRIESRLDRKFAGGNRGRTAVFSKMTKVQQVGLSPKDLDMSILHRIPEERISAVIGVPAIVAGLGAGLDRATYSNGREMREMYTEQRLVPWWRMEADRLNISLKPDFNRDKAVQVRADISRVRALQEDQDKLYKRLTEAAGQPWMTRNEARSRSGDSLDPVPDWDGEDTAPKPEPQPVRVVASNTEQDDEEDKALAAYERWAQKRLREGKTLSGFQNDDLSSSLLAGIERELLKAKTAEEVRWVFGKGARVPVATDLAAELKRANDLLEKAAHG